MKKNKMFPKKDTKKNIKTEVKKDYVRKSNILIDGQYRFNLNEQKILLTVLSRIKPMDKDFKAYSVPWEEIKRVTNGRLNTVKKIRGVCESLKNKTVILSLEGKEVGFGFLSGWTIEEGKEVEFRLDSGLKEMLLDLLENGNFTLYDLECVLSLSSVYSIRIYEMLKKSFFKKQPVVYKIDDLKWSLNIPLSSSSYSDFGNFRQRVIDKAQKDLKAHTDLSFTYKTIKENRRVVALEITSRENNTFQRTVQGSSGSAVVKAALKDGDVVVIAGQEYEYSCGVVMMNGGALPLGRLLAMLASGSAVVKKSSNN